MKWSTIPVPVFPVPLVHYSAGMLWLAGTIEGGYDKQGRMLIWNRVNRLPQITLSLYLPRHIYFYPLMYPNVSVCMDSVEDDSGEKRKLQLFQSTGSWQGMYSSENAVSLSYGYACWLGFSAESRHWITLCWQRLMPITHDFSFFENSPWGGSHALTEAKLDNITISQAVDECRLTHWIKTNCKWVQKGWPFTIKSAETAIHVFRFM